MDQQRAQNSNKHPQFTCEIIMIQITDSSAGSCKDHVAKLWNIFSGEPSVFICIICIFSTISVTNLFSPLLFWAVRYHGFKANEGMQKRPGFLWQWLSCQPWSESCRVRLWRLSVPRREKRQAKPFPWSYRMLYRQSRSQYLKKLYVVYSSTLSGVMSFSKSFFSSGKTLCLKYAHLSSDRCFQWHGVRCNKPVLYVWNNLIPPGGIRRSSTRGTRTVRGINNTS